MQAAVFRAGGIHVEERPDPVPGPGEALIRVTMAGICNTDIELFKGYYGFEGVAGHEFTGIVKESPTAPELTGTRVTGDINAGCGACPSCLSGNSRHCPARTVLGILGRDGAFAPYLTLPVRNLLPIPDGVPDRRAVFAEPLAAALEVGQQVHVTGRTKAAVLGDGKLGLLIALGLRLQTPHLVLLGKHDSKLALARAQGVATRLVDRDAPASSAEPSGSFDLVVEATGSPEGLAQALKMVRPEGTVVAKTTSRDPSSLDLAKVVVDEICIVGSRCGDISLALDHLDKSLVDVEPLIQKIHDFNDFKKAFADAATRGALKVLVRFPD